MILLRLLLLHELFFSCLLLGGHVLDLDVLKRHFLHALHHLSLALRVLVRRELVALLLARRHTQVLALALPRHLADGLAGGI